MAEELKGSGGDFCVRRAVLADCPAMLGLVKELANYEKALDRVSISLAEMEACGFGPHPLWGAFVVELTPPQSPTGEAQDPIIVGMALYYDRYSTWRGRLLYLEDFMVSKAYRGDGIGHQLFTAVLEHAKAKKYHGMTWQVLDWNEPALNFYRNHHAELDAEWINGSIYF
ncbi:unnamed protein product [Phytomonas sp. Hart1]|nr:unnamed protein product [Phytomonas sp. Hart1]|eukprot:CCW66898.1 unnamed protein product [Phytomonas sp. isolate Hart1]